MRTPIALALALAVATALSVVDAQSPDVQKVLSAIKAQDKGQQLQVHEVCASVLGGGAPPISLDELAATSRATFRALDSLRESRPFDV